MNKDVMQAIFLGLFLAIVGYRVYTKYFRKDEQGTSDRNKKSSSTSSSLKDDDYEPYLKK